MDVLATATCPAALLQPSYTVGQHSSGEGSAVVMLPDTELAACNKVCLLLK